MKTVLVAVKDERIIEKIRIALYDESIRYFYAQSADEAVRICMDNEISVLLCDFDLFVDKDTRLFEAIYEKNSDIISIILYTNSELNDLATAYNSSKISYVIDKNNLIVEDIYKYTMKALAEYNSVSSAGLFHDEADDLSKKFKTMNEMSAILNEKLDGYQSIINVYYDSIKFISSRSNEFLKPLRIYVDRILNDYIQLYLINSPDFDLYLSFLNSNFNKPSDKKYFAFSSKCEDVKEDIKNDILFTIDMITTCFDTFCKAYRGKLDLVKTGSNEGSKVLINAVYEFREVAECENVTSSILSINRDIVKRFAHESQFVRNGNIVQYRVIFDN